nr:hypothetical protein CLUG_02988 [Ipomoea batatas]
MLLGVFACLFHSKDIHTIHLQTRDIIPSLIIGRTFCCPPLCCPHAILIVLANQNSRQIPEGRDVQSLKQLPLVRSTISVHGERDMFFL